MKDFLLDRREGTFAWKNIGEGDIDWPEVRRALGEIGYSGYVTTEIQGGDLAYLKDVSARVDRFIAGEKPFTGPFSRNREMSSRKSAGGSATSSSGRPSSGWRNASR